MLLLKSITSVDRSIVPPGRIPDSYLSSRSCLHFHYASGFSTQILAYMLDSLVRVSRRVSENHFVRIAKTRIVYRPSITLHQRDNFVGHLEWHNRDRRLCPTRRVPCHFPQSHPPYRLKAITGKQETPPTLPSLRFSPANRTDSDTL